MIEEQDRIYRRHYRIFDSVNEVIEFADRPINSTWKSYRHMGMDFSHWYEVQNAARRPWQEGVDIVEDMKKQIMDDDIPVPMDHRRRIEYREDDGDEIDLDRLRSSQPYWRTSRRKMARGPATVTIAADVAVSMDRSPSDVAWRGAAALALTDVLEDAGYRVEFWTFHNSISTYKDGWGHCHAVCLKSADSPLDIETMVTCMSGWFYRSIWFAAKRRFDKDVVNSLGQPGSPSSTDFETICRKSDVIQMSHVYNRWSAVSLIKAKLKDFKASINPEPEPYDEEDLEPVLASKPIPEKPKTAAEIRKEKAEQKRAYKLYQAWLKKQRET